MESVGERRVASFLLRLWLEPREIDGQEPTLRGYIQHLQTGDEHYISDPEMIAAYVLRQLREEQAGREPQDADETSE